MRTCFKVAAAITLMIAGAGTVAAQDTGLAQALHALRTEGGKLCMSEHSHYGSSSGMASKKAAEAEAIKSWAGFTSFEYGNTWADYRLAAGKSMKCSQSAGGWGCELEARPCKRGGKR